jgi:cytochrome oxidase Cu insertion factor (SCO1/SenC/PrrC family)
MKFHNRLIAFTFIFWSSFLSFGQLENGSNAPNFILTDINGNQHTLYDYLDQGNTVYIDFFACHCPTCWNYHSSHSLSDLHSQYGPGTATNDVFVFAIELDPNNGNNEFYGISGTTQGNWVEGTNYPQFNPEGNLLTQLMSDFSVDYYPLIYAICPDKKITVIGTKTTAQLYEHVSSCATVLNVNENIQEITIQFINSNNNLIISIPKEKANSSNSIQFCNSTGQIVKSIKIETSNTEISLSFLTSGIYFVRLTLDDGTTISKKFIL